MSWANSMGGRNAQPFILIICLTQVFLHGCRGDGLRWVGWWFSFVERTTAVSERFFHNLWTIVFGFWFFFFFFQIERTALEISQRSPGWERRGCELLLITRVSPGNKRGKGRSEWTELGTLGFKPWLPHFPAASVATLRQSAPKHSTMKLPFIMLTGAVGREFRQHVSSEGLSLLFLIWGLRWETWRPGAGSSEGSLTHIRGGWYCF